MITKTKLKEQIESLSDEFTIDELIERLILIEKIESGYQQSESGNYVSESDLTTELEKWF
ncbi:hypothetical protein ES711_01500 [Gelidibacter salicanalis]|uniref:Addiction module protein n=1 Tax=Gelidibacter salicanalis TaxID=291193 RepID=A0A5C7AQB3_9FLAO|nr:hypothetical protein [Gelidibacter salicanalis]TXE10607.1 hypothetical protein ES711_01500 [Gelidibacter salicanalis]